MTGEPLNKSAGFDYFTSTLRRCVVVAVVTLAALLLASCGGATTLTETQAAAVPAATSTPAAASAVAPSSTPVRAVPTATPLPTVPPIPDVTPTVVPTPTAAPSVDPRCETGPNGGDHYYMQVVDVARDDADGGLVVHSDVGVAAPVVGVLPWNTNDIHWNYGKCEILASGAMWVRVYANDVEGWVNARYLGRRVQADDDLAVTRCVPASGNSELNLGLEPSSAPSAEAVHVNSISVQSTPECDRIVFELANNIEIGSTGAETAAVEFPGSQIDSISETSSAIEFRLRAAPDLYVDPWPEVWRDEATGELNAALVFVEDGLQTMRVGFGTGSASVRVAHDPARVIIDVVQGVTPDGVSVGPLTAGGAIIFDPITQDGRPVDGPFTIRGWSRGFEASSSLRLATWSESDDSLPQNWNGTLLGESAQGVDATIDPSPPFTDDDGMWYFMTTGIFEFTIDDLDPGAYQLMLSPDTGCGGPLGVVQQFHVSDPGSAKVAQRQPANWFAIHFGADQSPNGTPVIVTDADGDREVDWPTDRC